MTNHVLTAVNKGTATITLNRPEALNSLSLAMIRTLRSALDNWASDKQVQGVVLHSSTERALCAGGDIRFFYQAAQAGSCEGVGLLEDFFTEEYALVHTIASYPKPYISIMQGVVMGGGMGIAEPARLRIVTQSSKIAMPEVNIGLFPDVGGTRFLSHLPGQLGIYLGVTGQTITAADTLYCGMADLALEDRAVEGFKKITPNIYGDSRKEMVQKAHEIYGYENGLMNMDLQQSSLARMRPCIDAAFAQENISEIMQALNKESRPEFKEFATATLAIMRKRSPLLMQVSLKAIRRAKSMTLAQALRMERNLVRRTFEHGEVIEGVRALVIDKDHAPRWKPAQIDQVSDAMVEHFFSPCWPASMHPLRDL